MKFKELYNITKSKIFIYNRIVYYKNINEYGAYYLGEISEIKNDLSDYKVCQIYASDEGLYAEIISNKILYIEAKFINYSGKYINNHKNNFTGNLLSRLMRENTDTKYICYAESYPINYYDKGNTFYYKEFMEELSDYEKFVTNNKHGKIIMVFNYNGFFNSILEERNKEAKKLKKYMISNGWIFDKENFIVYKIIIIK